MPKINIGDEVETTYSNIPKRVGMVEEVDGRVVTIRTLSGDVSHHFDNRVELTGGEEDE